MFQLDRDKVCWVIQSSLVASFQISVLNLGSKKLFTISWSPYIEVNHSSSGRRASHLAVNPGKGLSQTGGKQPIIYSTFSTSKTQNPPITNTCLSSWYTVMSSMTTLTYPSENCHRAKSRNHRRRRDHRWQVRRSPYPSPEWCCECYLPTFCSSLWKLGTPSDRCAGVISAEERKAYKMWTKMSFQFEEVGKQRIWLALEGFHYLWSTRLLYYW